MPRFKLTLEYDGTGLAGWQRQPDRPSVQEYLETAAEKLTGARTEVVGAGRTDAGVHAIGQVAHVDIDRGFSEYNVMQGLNHHLLALSPQVVVTSAEKAADDFHARFDARSRAYIYRIVNRPARLALHAKRAWHVPEKLDELRMHEAAQLLVGHHDFTTFRDSECQASSPLKTLDAITVTRAGEEISIFVKARSFLHHQVRNIVGTLRLVGNKKWNAADLESALRACDRRRGGATAAPQGLYLVHVTYG